jgi:hypothetical protein
MNTRGKIDRRAFLVASTAGVAGFRFGQNACAATNDAVPVAPAAPRAKSTILFFLCGGSSHIDMWDMKPHAPSEFRGEFDPINTSAPEIQLCEHLPMTAKQAHNLAIVRTVADRGQATGDHHAGYYYNLTGHVPDLTFKTQGNDRRPYPDDWPFMGSVIGSRRPAHPALPQVITLPHKPSRAPYTRPGQFAAKLGFEHDPFYVYGSENDPLRFTAPSLTLQAGRSLDRLGAQQELLTSFNSARRQLDHVGSVTNFTNQQQKAFSLLASTGSEGAFDIAGEPESVRKRYGETTNGMSLLMARKLVEAGVPFVTVFWKENLKIKSKCRSAGGWDTHGSNFSCLKDYLLPEFDRAYSALLEDLVRRDLLDQTLVAVSSEMGRRPRIGDRRSGGVSGAGRDHWTALQSIVLAGGGIRGGQTYGKSDKVAEYPAENPVGPEDITKTIYHAMGMNDLQAVDAGGRPFNLLDEGRPLTELF